MTRVLLVDDHAFVRAQIAEILTATADLQVTGECADGDDVLTALAAAAPDVVLMDVRMPQMTGVEATRALRERGERPRILILTTFDDDQYVFDALKAGAAGYVLKDLPAADLAAAIRTVHGGGVHLDPSVASKVVAELARLHAPASPPAPSPIEFPPALFDDLTPREREVLRFLATGASNREIGAQLFISEGTVKNHISNILSRLGLRDRTAAAIYAREHGLL
jgi:DNA-binding NarL/FixJ family response regulator